MIKSAIRRLKWRHRNSTDEEINNASIETLIVARIYKQTYNAQHGTLHFVLYDPMIEFDDQDQYDRITGICGSAKSAPSFAFLSPDAKETLEANYEKVRCAKPHSLVTIKGILRRREEAHTLMVQLVVTTGDLITATSQI